MKKNLAVILALCLCLLMSAALAEGVSLEEAERETCMSGIPSRPYCKGRNYDPNRYNSTEE